MALSNAERQKRHRERVKDALRNANAGPQGRSLPLILVDYYRWLSEQLPEDDELQCDLKGDIEDLVRSVILRMINEPDNILCGSYILEHPELVSLLGGADFVNALIKWDRERSLRPSKRGGKKSLAPEPPPLPVT
ncbi:hypothetical protein [Pararhodospirillum photometricum]|uniref:hypothetical protein n=1 Tax=Pararhodospirillum photometricum TaxID=1084 RepID=UPI0012FF2C47|nr:hypothetical protein [Pararhodospirillum photometricum]